MFNPYSENHAFMLNQRGIPLYSIKQIREIEHLAIAQGVSAEAMMQRAAQAVSETILKDYPYAKQVVIFCGSGNNGGDGYATAYRAHKNGLNVQIRHVGHSLKKDSLWALDLCQKASLDIQPFDSNEPSSADLYIDALLGIGVEGPLSSDIISAIQYLNQTGKPVLSIDLPSGVDADTGALFGFAVKADQTVTFIGHKQGLFTGPALDARGKIICNDLGLANVLSTLTPIAYAIHHDALQTEFKPRLKTVHKGNCGHTLVIGGSTGMIGAPFLAALGAARIGSGLVTIASPAPDIGCLTAQQPEIMCRTIQHVKDLDPLLEKATVVVIGPGLRQSKMTAVLCKKIFAKPLPLIVDADALNYLSSTPEKQDHWVLTPHPGEAAKLLKTSVAEIQKNRFQTAQVIQARYGGVCVLKGAGTLMVDSRLTPSVCLDGNPGMASGGMGDLLAGIIGGLVAQGCRLEMAAQLGVCIHAKAGDLAAEDGEKGLLATDLLPFIRQLA